MTTNNQSRYAGIQAILESIEEAAYQRGFQHGLDHGQSANGQAVRIIQERKAGYSEGIKAMQARALEKLGSIDSDIEKAEGLYHQIRDQYQEGCVDGYSEGYKAGKAQGHAQGIREGRASAKSDFIRALNASAKDDPLKTDEDKGDGAFDNNLKTKWSADHENYLKK